MSGTVTPPRAAEISLRAEPDPSAGRCREPSRAARLWPCPLPAPHSSSSSLLNAVGYVVALATGLVDPLPGFLNGSKTNAPLVIWAAQTVGVLLGRRLAITLLACTVSLAAAAFDGDLGAAGLGAGQVAIQLGIAAATPRSSWSPRRGMVAADAPARRPRRAPRPRGPRVRGRQAARPVRRNRWSGRVERAAGRQHRRPRSPDRPRRRPQLQADRKAAARPQARPQGRALQVAEAQLPARVPGDGRPDPDGQLQGPLDLRLDDGQGPEAPQPRAAPPRAADRTN